MKKCLTIFVCLLSALFFAACQKQDTSVSKTGFYFDTVIKVTLYDADAKPELESCFASCRQVWKTFKCHEKRQWYWNINHAKGKPVVVIKETISLLQKAIDYSERSDGAFDITIGELSSLWDFGENKDTVPSQKDINAALPTVDYHNIEISDNTVTLKNPKTQIDLGGIAKGYIADQMKAQLRSDGITEGIINLGGNVLTVRVWKNPAILIRSAYKNHSMILVLRSHLLILLMLLLYLPGSMNGILKKTVNATIIF